MMFIQWQTGRPQIVQNLENILIIGFKLHIIKVLENYPRIGLAISCRTSYERRVIPKDLTPDSFVKIVHRGFSDSEYIATKNFFEHYGIERPRIPLLVPEFSNPLFLKIFCQGLQKRGLTTTPQGIKGVTAIFNFFIDTIHEVLCNTYGSLIFNEGDQIPREDEYRPTVC